jgi:hypothetical protein
MPTAQDSDDEENIEQDEFIATHDALDLVRNPKVPTLAPPQVEKTVWQKTIG